MNDAGVGDAAEEDAAAEVDSAAGTELLASRIEPPVPTCPSCAAPRPAEGRFCERCGADLVTAVAPAPERWIVEIVADRQLFERVCGDGLVFPEGRQAVTLDLTEVELPIGRRQEAHDSEPALDLSGPLRDPAASHRHAVLTRLDDGAYAVTDLGSTNGTELNGGQVTLEPGRQYALAHGDRIHIGAWTTIVVRRSR